MKTIRILLADDHSLIRMGLAALFKYQKDIKVVGEAEDGDEAVRLALRLKPDVVVMDLAMPVMDGATATARIRETLPETRVLILTSFGTSADLSRALAAGATGALNKDSGNDELLTAIRTVADGGRAVSDEIARLIEEEPAPPDFTERQLEVLHAVTRGLTNAEIGRQFGISADAVKQHVNAIFAKLGAANRTEAVTIALRKQLLKM